MVNKTENENKPHKKSSLELGWERQQKAIERQYEDKPTSNPTPKQQFDRVVNGVSEVTIADLYADRELIPTNDGGYKTECPCCGLQGGRTQGFIIFPEGDRAYCHSSLRTFGILEAYALKKGIIQCMDGREKGQKGAILKGDTFKQTIDALNDDYDDDFVSKLYDAIGLKEKIELPNNGKLTSTFADQIAKRLYDKDMFFYRTDTKQVVEISKVKDNNGNLKYTGFSEIKPSRFITLVEKYFRPWDKKERQNGTIKYTTKSMSRSVAATVLVSDNFIDKIKPINMILTVPMPTIYNGQITFPNRGYDERFGSWLPYDAPTITNPEMSVDEAKEIIGYLYKEFCFQNKQDFTHSVAALITPLLRGLYKRITCRTPLFVQKGNRERSGKDYNEGVRSILYTGVHIEEPPVSTGEKGNNSDEFRKKIASAFMAGRTKYHIANNKGRIDNAALEAVLTSETYSDRLLGANKMGEWSNIMEFSLSGNVGMTMTADLINRSRTINLFLDVEDANSRKFENPDLHGWVRNNRSLILSAVYALVRNWFEKGMPDGKVPFTSYPEWARVCGGVMEAAGYDSPCMKEKEMLGLAVDTETSEMKSLFEICYEKYKSKAITKAEIKSAILAEEDDDLFANIDWEKKSDQIKFGISLNKFVGRILSDISLKVINPEVRTQRWKYVFSKETSNFDKKSIVTSKFVPEVAMFGHDGHVLPSSSFMDTRESVNGSSQIMPNIAKHDHQKVMVKKKDVLNYIKSNPNYTIKELDEKFGKQGLNIERQIQFTEAEECKGIIPTCTKEEVRDWIKANPDYTSKQLYDKFGVGSIKFKNEIVSEGQND